MQFLTQKVTHVFESHFGFLHRQRYYTLSQVCWNEVEGISPRQGGEEKQASWKNSWRWEDSTGGSSAVFP